MLQYIDHLWFLICFKQRGGPYGIHFNTIKTKILATI
jgi:hypothetical protein